MIDPRPPHSARRAYLDGSNEALATLADPGTHQLWDAPSALEGMSVGHVAAHLARSILQVESFLNAPVGDGDSELVDAIDYYARLTDAADYNSDLNQGVRSRSVETAEPGAAAVNTSASETLSRLTGRLPHEPSERRIPILHHPGEVMLLDEYLRTRCVELVVHIEDLSLSICKTQVTIPNTTLTTAVEVLVSAARRRHGDREVLHALARRGRDRYQALRVL